MFKLYRCLVCLLFVFLLGISLSSFGPSAEAKIRYYSNVDSSNFPTDLQNNLSSHPWEQGFLDVTQAPYSAAGDGITDDSDAIQAAVDDAYRNNLIVYFPAGTYLVSKQIKMEQLPDYVLNPDSSFPSQRKFGHILMGDTSGAGRAVIKLQDGSTMTSNTYDQAVLYFRFYDPVADKIEPSRHYLATVRDIDLDMGDNSQFNGISMAAAQLSTIENVNITGEAFNAGIYNIPGSGGSIVNVSVTGGNIGIYQQQYRPSPLAVGVRLINQAEYGIKLLDTRGPLTLTGFEIVSPDQPQASYRAIYTSNTTTGSGDVNHANLSLVDGKIEVKGTQGKAIYNFDQSVTMKDVYIKADTLIESGISTPPTESVSGDSQSWKKFNSYIFSTGADEGSVHLDGTEYANTTADYQTYNLASAAPAEDFVAKHIWGDMPSWQDSDLVSILTYGATPDDDSDNDAVAIQQAIDDVSNPTSSNYGKTVYIPRGHFHIKSQIELKQGLKLIGAGKNISVIQVHTSWTLTGQTSAIISENVPDGGLILSDFAIVAEMPNPTVGTATQKYLTHLKIQSGKTTARDLQFSFVQRLDEYDLILMENFYRAPMVVMSGHAGGDFYNVIQLDDSTLPYQGNIHEEYRFLLIDETYQPLNFYVFDIEHAQHSPQAEIRKANNIKIYGLKYENQDQLLRMSDSRHVWMFGGSGNYSILNPNDKAIIELNNVDDVNIFHLNRKPKSTSELTNALWIQNGSEEISDDDPVVAYTTHRNLLQNGGFEDGTNGWQPYGSVQIATNTTDQLEGDTSLRITDRNQLFEGPIQDIRDILVANGPGDYQVEAWVKNLSGISDMSMKIRTNDGSDQYRTVTVTNVGTDWKKLSGTVSMNWSGTLAEAALYFTNSAATASYDLDDVFMAIAPAAATAVELISNGDFESGTTDWNEFGSVSIAQESDMVYEGEASMKVSSRNISYEGPFQDITAALLSAGQGTYSAEAFLKNSHLSGGITFVNDIPTPATSTVNMKIRLKTGGMYTYVSVNRFAEDYRWKRIFDTVQLSWTGTLEEAVVYFTNDETNWDYYLDKVSLVKQ